MSLVKILILSNVFDPTATLGELLDAFRCVDAIERDELDTFPDWELESADEREEFVRNLAVLP